MRTAFSFIVILVVYGLLLAAAAVLLPLRLGEILQAAAFLKFSWAHFFGWIAQSPGGAPLHYLTQLPFALAQGDSRLLLRLPSLTFAVGSAFLFFALAKRIPLSHPTLALVLFLLIPVHLAYATQGRPFELALFFSLLAANLFFALVDSPNVYRAALYVLALAGCLYSQPSSYLPAGGYVVYLLGFANLPRYRKALWYSLVATLLPLVIYAPYWAWATAQRRPDWLVEQFPAYAVPLTGVQALMSLTLGAWTPWFGLSLMALLLVGLAGGIWSALPLGAYPDGTPPPSAAVMQRRVILFCLAGGAIVTVLAETAVAGWTRSPFSPYQILWALPGLVLLLCGALDALVRWPPLKPAAFLNPVICGIAIVLCIPGDIEYMQTVPPDIAKLTEKIRPQLTGDSCLVFVSQRLSRYLFEVFDPSLDSHACQNFFHSRVVLAIHPYVRPDQERDARIFFRGLDFEETHRDILGDGKVITMDAAAK